LADTPDNIPTPEEDAFLREVDEELRRAELTSIWERYGRLFIGGLVGMLALVAGFLFWTDHKAKNAGIMGERFDKALERVDASDVKGADQQFSAIAKDDQGGYRVSALFSQAGLAIKANNLKKAADLYDQIAKDPSVPQQWRDMALVRKTTVEFDSLKPADVIARISPLVNKDNAQFGSAAELKAIALMKMGRKEEAGKLFAAIYKEETVPQSLRDRALRMTSVLGVNLVDQAKEVKIK
jgi:hypothetical protein